MSERRRLTIGPLVDPVIAAREAMWADWIEDCDLMVQAWVETMLATHEQVEQSLRKDS